MRSTPKADGAAVAAPPMLSAIHIRDALPVEYALMMTVAAMAVRAAIVALTKQRRTELLIFIFLSAFGDRVFDTA
jgi:hypothetical protein